MNRNYRYNDSQDDVTMKSRLYHGSSQMIETLNLVKVNYIMTTVELFIVVKVLNLAVGEYHILNWLAILLENRTFRMSSEIAQQAYVYIQEHFMIDCRYDHDDFFSMFICSGIASQIEKGNPKYIAGMSGVELVFEIVVRATGSYPSVKRIIKDHATREYWAGWILAYYQWHSGLRFSDMVENGLSLSKVLSLYTLHEADQSKFFDVADKMINTNKQSKQTKLTHSRKARGFTQAQLATISKVNLRMIQLYEQRQNDINKAQAATLKSLAQALGCEMQDLMEL